MKHATWLAALLLVCSPGWLCAGEAEYYPADSSMPYPRSPSFPRVEVRDARVSVTFLADSRAATVRAEYSLRCLAEESETVEVGLPVACLGVSERGPYEGHPGAPVIHVKLDGRPVVTRMLTLFDLAGPTVNEWQDEIAELLQQRPALRRKVESVRRESADRLSVDGDLAKWMRMNIEADWRPYGTGPIAAGLLGIRPHWSGVNIRRALQWLDPNREFPDLYGQVSSEWGPRGFLLEPRSGQLIDAGGRGAFVIFVFALTLTPGTDHTLVVQHRQGLGGSGPRSDRPFHGMRYILTNANGWPGYRHTHIEVRVPEKYGNVVIRPRATPAGVSDGYAAYQIEMKWRPVEELYVSAQRAAASGRGRL